VTVADAQNVPLLLVLNVDANVPFDAAVPDIVDTTGPEHVPDDTRTVTDAPPMAAPVAASLALVLSGTMKRFPDLVMVPFVTTTFMFRDATTVTDALPVTPCTVAVTDPLPAVDPAENVVPLPVVGETAPGAVVDHAASLAETGFPWASAALAEKACVLPKETVELGGDTTTVATGPATTVSDWVPEAYPLALAVSVGVPAVTSS
jgi:hypothetical protein